MKVLITGSTGQLGKALGITKPAKTEIYAMNRNNFNMLNIPKCVDIIKSLKPDWLINCAAYTNVDLAESQEETAMSINFHAPKALALEIKKMGGRFLQISTDYVFDGTKKIFPYSTFEKKSPLSVYGISKAKAEEAIEKIFEETNRGIILRTSWLMGPFGKNFLLTILNLHLKNKEIKVVDDQIGSPTNVFGLAEVCWKILGFEDYSIIKDRSKNGILHWHDDGETNWYEVALRINQIGKKIGLIKNNSKIVPIKTTDFPTSAKRPSYSVLDCNSTIRILNHKNSSWEFGIEKILNEVYLDNGTKYCFKQMQKK